MIWMSFMHMAFHVICRSLLSVINIPDFLEKYFSEQDFWKNTYALLFKDNMLIFRWKISDLKLYKKSHCSWMKREACNLILSFMQRLPCWWIVCPGWTVNHIDHISHFVNGEQWAKAVKISIWYCWMSCIRSVHRPGILRNAVRQKNDISLICSSNQ